MPEYRRILYQGGTYFFTLVTYKRQKIFLSHDVSFIFYESLEHIQRLHPFTNVAYCIMPDHIHLIWRLPEDDANYSMRISQIKRRFARAFVKKYGIPVVRNMQHEKRRELTIWQRRFWEHLIRDEADLNQHIDYIHYNPVKHGMVDRVCDWVDSSFHRYVQEGYYDANWSEGCKTNEKDNHYGE